MLRYRLVELPVYMLIDGLTVVLVKSLMRYIIDKLVERRVSWGRIMGGNTSSLQNIYKRTRKGVRTLTRSLKIAKIPRGRYRKVNFARSFVSIMAYVGTF